jgi:hypothetical protein
VYGQQFKPFLKMDITITIPNEIAKDVIEKAAKLRKSQQSLPGNHPRKNRVTVDVKLDDEDFLKAEILQNLLSDYKEVLRAEAMQEAGKKAAAEADAKIKALKL